jgi:uncharacterized protein (DUF362 family)
MDEELLMNLNMTLVSIQKCKNNDVKTAVYKAITESGFSLNKKINTVAIKLNLCYYWDSSTGETTDKRVVSAVIDYIREFYNPDAKIVLVEADATSMKTKYSFKILGYTDFAKEKNVELFNLSDDEYKIFSIPLKSTTLSLPIPLIMLNSDLVINIPKLKVPRRVPLTCAMKNLFGAIHNPIKAKYHPYLHEVIASVNGIIKPDLVVVDGLVALGSHPYKMDIILAGTNSVSVDWVAAKIVGYRNPRKIEYIRLAEKNGYGKTDIKIVGENIEELSNVFPKINIFWFNLKWKLQLKGIKIYTQLTGDIIPPVLGDL